MREAHFTSSALGDQLGLLSVCLVCPCFSRKYTLSSGRVTTLLPLGVLTEIFKYCVFSLFLDQFHQRFTLHICGLRGPENGHISLFLDQFHQRLRLHICGLRGPENGSVLTSGDSRPCSAVECVMRCSLNENSTVRTFFGTLAANPTVGDYNVG